MKKEVEVISYGDEPMHGPERGLWVAVVERAMRDYCWYLQSSDLMRGFSWAEDRSFFPVKGQNEHKKLIRDYRVLRWFLFSKKPAPYNLEYIYTNFLEDFGGIANVRRYCSTYHKAHLESLDGNPKYTDIIADLRAMSGRDKPDPTIKIDELRPRR